MRHNSTIISRLTALWALVEAGLGGVMHALQFPFTGLFVGGFAVVLISLIAYFSDNKWNTIFRSLLVVLIIKLAVSPHSPPDAYLAVTFQALMAGTIYSKLSLNMWSAMLLGVVTMVESAIQKLLVLTLIYGNSLWKAINSFGDYISGLFSFMAGVVSTQVLITLYLWAYVLIGILVGFFIYDMMRYLEYNKGNIHYQIKAIEFDLEFKVSKKRRGRWKIWLLWGGVLLLILAYVFFTKDGDSLWKNGLYIILRSIGILLIWYYLIGPLFTKWLKKFLENKQSRVQKEVDETLTLLPYLKNIIELAWKENKSERGYTRFRNFMGDSILYGIHLQLDEED
jgi:hypothetical protein